MEAKLWSLADVWNRSLDDRPERDVEPRNYMWASELGGSYYDRYWKMHGRTPTTPPNLRSRRKFEAGNLTEWVVKQILVRAGVYRGEQQYVVNDQNDIAVTGRCDFIAGGEIEEVDFEDLPESLAGISYAVIESLKKMYPEGLAEVILEVKSCSAIIFEKYQKAPAKKHALQLFHYASFLNKTGRLVYICKDDLRMVEWTIDPNSEEWSSLYQADVEQMAAVLQMSEEEVEKVKEPLLVWDEDDKKFKKNFKVEYSLYLTDYGYERPDQYAEPVGKLASRINRVVTRIKEGKPLTDNNKQAIEEVIKFYPPALEVMERLENSR